MTKSVAAPAVHDIPWAVVFDTETTGLVKNMTVKLNKQPEIIEFYGCVVDLSSGAIAEELELVIKPTVEFPMSAYTIRETKTKLSNELLEDAPRFKEVADEVRKFLEDAPMTIAHNHSFDRDMVNVEYMRLGQDLIAWPKRTVCTVEQTIHLRGRRLNLTALHELLFEVKFENAHRARNDVEALTRIACELHKRGMI